MIRLVVAALIALAATPAPADVWTVAAGSSEVRFRVSAMGGEQRGRFRDWSGSIEFEPERPTEAEVRLAVQAGSLVMDDRSLTGMATGPDFLDARRFPEIVFQLVSLAPLSDTRFQATADVTVKGRTRVVRFPVDLRITGDTAQMTGGFSLRRADFGIGTSGIWNTLTGRDVRVDVTLNARRTP